jgi:hypothetical protein
VGRLPQSKPILGDLSYEDENIKKRITAVFVTFAMVMMLLPVTASAAVNVTDIYITPNAGYDLIEGYTEAPTLIAEVYGDSGQITDTSGLTFEWLYKIMASDDYQTIQGATGSTLTIPLGLTYDVADTNRSNYSGKTPY